MSVIRKFIEDNKITFERGSRNSSVTTLIGYALYKGVSQDQLLKELDDEINADSFIGNEIFRLFPYCQLRNYGSWWENEKNRKTFII